MTDRPPPVTFELATFPMRKGRVDGFCWCVRRYEAETGWRLLAEGWHPTRKKASAEGEKAWRRASRDWSRRHDPDRPADKPEY
jgi:hypothetical protein